MDDKDVSSYMFEKKSYFLKFSLKLWFSLGWIHLNTSFSYEEKFLLSLERLRVLSQNMCSLNKTFLTNILADWRLSCEPFMHVWLGISQHHFMLKTKFNLPPVLSSFSTSWYRIELHFVLEIPIDRRNVSIA